MNARTIFRAVRPFISALAVLATAGALVFTIYFTQLGLQWVTFLAGVLVAALLAEATRVSRIEWRATLRSARLSATRDKLEHEMQARKRAEEALAAARSRLHLIDEVMPTMIALFDAEGQCQYHNRAFATWLGLRPDQIKGQHLRKLFGSGVYQEMAASIRQSLDGHAVHYERTQTMPSGSVYRLQFEHQPQLGEDGRVSGFYMLVNDVTGPDDVHTSHDAASPLPPHDALASQSSFVDSFSEQIAGQKDIGYIRAAIEKGEFRLYCQLITPVAGADKTEHYEILVRLLEEEEGMMPPGAFFPLAEKYGLMPHLDRWVIQHVADWATRQPAADAEGPRSMFFINVSAATIKDTGFGEFLQLTLVEYGVPGTAFCFEIPNSELSARPETVAAFAQRARQHGCRVAISGFGQERIAFDLIRGFRVDFLKIDGSIILNVPRDPVNLAKVKAIDSVAKKIGVKTIAELVESDDTLVALKEIGVDFAQGFGISRPRPLEE